MRRRRRGSESCHHTAVKNGDEVGILPTQLYERKDRLIVCIKMIPSFSVRLNESVIYFFSFLFVAGSNY